MPPRIITLAIASKTSYNARKLISGDIMFRFIEEFKMLRIACDILDEESSASFKLERITSEELYYSNNSIFVLIDYDGLAVFDGLKIKTSINVEHWNFICRRRYIKKYRELRNLEIKRLTN